MAAPTVQDNRNPKYRLDFDRLENNPENVFCYKKAETHNGHHVNMVLIVLWNIDPRDGVEYNLKLLNNRGGMVVRKKALPAFARANARQMIPGDAELLDKHNKAIARLTDNPEASWRTITYYFPEGVRCYTAPYSFNPNHPLKNNRDIQFTFGNRDADGNLLQSERNCIEVRMAIQEEEELNSIGVDADVQDISNRFGYQVNLG